MPGFTFAQTAPLYKFDDNQVTRWSSPENRNGIKGRGAMENNGAKGHPSDPILPGETDTLLNIQGQGIINRIWITIRDRSPEMLRSLKLEMYWDNDGKPAVSVPFGDFFGIGLGKTTSFQNSLFANPEGRSFNCFIPMPFKKAAKIIIINESAKTLSHVFFDIDYSLLKQWNDDYMYFHAYWHRDTSTTVGKDFELLPGVSGKGRFIGVNVGINANPAYKNTWWGEGEVKIYLDGDRNFPTLAGTGTEDYIGTAWGQGKFINHYTGCLVADDSLKQWCFYRYHIPDPVFFSSDCRVTIQQMGGASKAALVPLQESGIPLVPAATDVEGKFPLIYKKDSVIQLKNSSITGWVDYFRSDDVSATAYFYLDKPSSALPALQTLAIRTYHLK